ncbi:hypothetical protein BV20DRAFT_848658 [Pilatotrama ljubarskyi]|nr:hypothetical protein BV20DRAFT_848658 [Pilatotrama ljubarskyi]
MPSLSHLWPSADRGSSCNDKNCAPYVMPSRWLVCQGLTAADGTATCAHPSSADALSACPLLTIRKAYIQTAFCRAFITEPRMSAEGGRTHDIYVERANSRPILTSLRIFHARVCANGHGGKGVCIPTTEDRTSGVRFPCGVGAAGQAECYLQ